MALLIGMDIGGTNLRLGIIQHDAQAQSVQRIRLVDEMRFQADFSGLCKNNPPEVAWREILSTITGAIKAAQQKYPEIVAVGIGFPGFIDPVTQNISQSPNLPGLKNVALSADLMQLISLPVITENDALAAAYGEYIMQSPQRQDLLYIGLGTGVGGGLVIHGRPFPGQHGVAMEIGHLIYEPGGRVCGCGNQGCMEQYASASGVSISYFNATQEHCQALEIALRAQGGDPHALEAYTLAGTALAATLAHILKVLDVNNIVIGGGMSGGWALMKEAFELRLEQDLIPALRGKTQLSISHVGDHAGIIGAAILAEQQIKQASV
jgi:glucokinase